MDNRKTNLLVSELEQMEEEDGVPTVMLPLPTTLVTANV